MKCRKIYKEEFMSLRKFIKKKSSKKNLLLLLVFIGLVSLLRDMTLPYANGGQGFFGYWTAGGTSEANGENELCLSRFQYIGAGSGVISTLSIYVAQTGGGDYCYFKGVVYHDNSGTVGTFMNKSSQILVSSSSPYWQNFTVSAAVTVNSYYWIGFTEGTHQAYYDSFSYFDSGSSNQRAKGTETYDLTPDSPSVSYSSYEISCYATVNITPVINTPNASYSITIPITQTQNDGWLLGQSNNYTLLRNAGITTNGVAIQGLYTDGTSNVGQNNLTSSYWGGTAVSIDRSILKFDTSVLANTSISIAWAKLSLSKDTLVSNSSYNVDIQGETYTGTSYIDSSYWSYFDNVTYGSFTAADITNSSLTHVNGTITDFSCINQAGGYTQFMLRIDSDVQGYAPSLNQSDRFTYYESDYGTGNTPELILGYNGTYIGGSIGNTPSIPLFDIPSHVALALGITSFQAGILVSLFVVMFCDLPVLIFASDNIIAYLVFSIISMCFCVALDWLPYWTLIIIIFMCAMMFSMLMRNWITGHVST